MAHDELYLDKSVSRSVFPPNDAKGGLRFYKSSPYTFHLQLRTKGKKDSITCVELNRRDVARFADYLESHIDNISEEK